MKIFTRIYFWIEGAIWRSRVNAETRRAARLQAKRAIYCSRCTAPLFPNEMPDRLCVHCRTYGSSGPRPLGMGEPR